MNTSFIYVIDGLWQLNGKKACLDHIWKVKFSQNSYTVYGTEASYAVHSNL